MDAVNTNPLSFRLAAAYGVTPKARASSPTASATSATSVGSSGIAPTQTDRVDASLTRIRPLVATTVPGKIDFSAGTPQQSTAGGTMPMYRHPYDKNAAATGVASGKAIDVTG